MYNIPYHKEKDKEIIRSFIAEHPFAFLSGCDQDNKPVATQLPLFIEKVNGKEVLRGHIMKENDHHQAFVNNENVLAIFSGKHCYVSGTWYTNPNTPSTWNYMSVHVTGKIRFVEEAELEEILRSVSLHFENHNPDSPTTFDNLPESFRKRALKMIAGFEIEITEIDTVFKLSQDRDQDSYLNIIQQLKQQDADAQVIAMEMEKRMEELFSDNG